MNILKRELKSNLKALILWTLGLFFLVFAGITKFQGISGANAESINQMLALYPKPLLAILGMPEGVNLATISGYNSVIAYYSMICASIYAISLGTNVINRELVDKTYEFIFTKPISRTNVLKIKITASIICLFIFCILNYVFNILAIKTLNLNDDISKEVLLYSISIFIVAMIYLAIAILTATILKRSEKAFTISNAIFTITFLLGGLFDMVENNAIIKFFTPLRYFTYNEIQSNTLNNTFTILSCFIVCVSALVFYRLFEKKDLTAV